jgi:sec-independent protein translocase protein TatA
MNEWVIVGIVAIVVIFGATKLPEIARNLGRSSGEFKRGLKEGVDETAAPAEPPREAAPPAAEPPAPVEPPRDETQA